MPFAKKRKISETSDHDNDAQSESATMTTSADDPGREEITTSTGALEKDILPDKDDISHSDIAARDQDERRERFRALRIRAVSRISPMKAFCRETLALASLMKTHYFSNADKCIETFCATKSKRSCRRSEAPVDRRKPAC